MCKIDLPRKNMVIERERARGRRKRGCWESAYTHMHSTIGKSTREKKSAGLGGMGGEKKTFSSSLVPLPIKKNEVHQQ